MAHMLFGCKLVGLINRDENPMFNWGWANGSINEDWGFLTFGFWLLAARRAGTPEVWLGLACRGCVTRYILSLFLTATYLSNTLRYPSLERYDVYYTTNNFIFISTASPY